MRTSRLASVRDNGMLRLYAWVMIITAGLAVVVALHVTRTGPRYSAAAEVVLAPTITRSGNYIQPSMPTERRVATSTEVVSDTATRVGATTEQAAERISVAVPVDTQVLVLTYTADTPDKALSGAKALATSYLQIRNPKDGKNPVARLVSPPELPSAPVKTNYPAVLGAAVLGGLLTGYAFAGAWDRVRGRVRTVADVERCADLDALTLTPRLPRPSKIGHQRAWAGRSQLDPLAARVLGQVEEGSQSSVLVTGAGTDCGGSTVAALTAIALARMGRSVVLVTADDEVLARLSRDRAAQRDMKAPSRSFWPETRASEQDGLHLVAVAEWDLAGVAAARLTNLIPELHRRLPEALIVIDGPPAWCSAGIALRVDKILLVVELGRCSRKATTTAGQALDHCAEKIMGLVITPRRGRTRRGLASVGAWTSRQVRRIVFRIAPPAVAPASTSAPRSRSGTTLGGPDWTDQMSLKAPRSSVPEDEHTGDVVPLRNPRSSDEPTSSVGS